MAKYSGIDGRPQWFLHIGGAGAITNVNGVAADGAGGVYVTGAFTGTVNFPGGSFTSAGPNDAFLMKFDGVSGAYVWSVQIGGTGAAGAYGVRADASGNLVVTGYFSGTANFGGTQLVSSNTSGFVAKYAAQNGQLFWTEALGGTGWAIGSNVALGVNGTTAVTGRFSGSVDFGGGALASAGGTDIFLAMYDTNGAHLWSRALGGAGNDNGSGVATDSSGNPVITGYFYDNVDFGGGPLAGAANRSAIFVAKYAASNGAYLWAKSFTDVTTPPGVSADVVANGVVVDGGGNIALTGALTGNVDFGGGLLAGSGADIFIAELSASGAYRWAQRFVALFPDAGSGITCDANADVLIAGSFGQAVNFGGGALSPGSGNAFVAKYASTTTQNSPTATPTPSRLPATLTPAVPALSGTIDYYGSAWPVSGVVVQLVAPLQAPTAPQIHTDAVGQFGYNATAGTNYEIVPQKMGGAAAAISSLDAVYALQAAAGRRTLTPQEQLACDVNGNGSVSAFDAALILQYVVGARTSFPVAQTCGSDWAFVPKPSPIPNQQVIEPQVSPGSCRPGSIAYRPLAGQASGQDFTAVVFGDCNANWQPPTGGAALSVADAGPAEVQLGSGRQRGEHLRVPVRVNSSGAFQALDVEVQYDPTQLAMRGVHRVGAARQALLQTNRRLPGHLAIGLASAEPLDGGTVLILEFTTHGGRAAASTIRIAQASAQ